LEVAPRFIKSLPGLFHWDPCAHEFIAPVMGLLTVPKILELMEREFALYALLWRIAAPSSRWRMEESHFRLLAGLQEEVEIAIGVLAILLDDASLDSGDWGRDPLGSLIDRLLVVPARAHINAEHTSLLEIRDDCEFTGTLEHGVNPVGRALA